MNTLHQIVHKYFRWLYRPILKIYHSYLYWSNIHKDMRKFKMISPSNVPYIFYLGITNHSNLGDMAQYYCILNWIKENYSEYQLVKFESNTVVSPISHWMDKFKNIYKNDDIIIFQSGYTTQDLGGNHEEMHRLIIDNFPNAKILMMPQTIFFNKEENRRRTSLSYDKANHMLFLARDYVSYQQAKKMFPHINIMAFPDIVTTLIGTKSFNTNREGVCLCRRNDGEKYYSESQLKELENKIENFSFVDVIDTTINASVKTIRKNLEHFIMNEIERFSHYQVTITDRYHGTIFSLVAGTPVIIIKTTDHKVITGADWFKGIYDGYVYVARDLDDALFRARSICSDFQYHELNPYFKEKYYDHLKEYFEKISS